MCHDQDLGCQYWGEIMNRFPWWMTNLSTIDDLIISCPLGLRTSRRFLRTGYLQYSNLTIKLSIYTVWYRIVCPKLTNDFSDINPCDPDHDLLHDSPLHRGSASRGSSKRRPAMTVGIIGEPGNVRCDKHTHTNFLIVYYIIVCSNIHTYIHTYIHRYR